MLIFLLFSSWFNYRAPLVDKVDPRCLNQETMRVWVYFTDKAVSVDAYPAALSAVRAQIAPVAWRRRAQRGKTVDYADLPVADDYVAKVEAAGGILIRTSRWLNAASFFLRREDLSAVADLPFVFRVAPVASYAPALSLETSVRAEDTLVYGLSYHQLKMFNIDKLHERSVFGSNVTVGVMDTGLKRRHNALQGIRVVGEYDFYGGDQVFFAGIPVTDKYGVYSALVPHLSTSGRWFLFLEGDTLSNNVPVRDILYTWSDDLGNSWQPLRKMTNLFNDWAVETAVCGRDTMFIFYRDRNGLNYLVYSSLNDSLLKLPTTWLGGSREPSVVQVRDTVYVFYQRRNQLYLRPGTYNSEFAGEMLLDTTGSSRLIRHPAAVASSDKIGVFYHSSFPDSLFFLRCSLTAGNFQRSSLFAGKNAQAVAIGDTICLVWCDNSNPPLFRIGFTRSDDFGVSFRPAQYLAEQLTSLGRIAVQRRANAVMVAWESAGRIYYRQSSDGGQSFGLVDSLPLEFAYLPFLISTASGINLGYAVRGDSDTYDASVQPNHGTEMLGLIGGYSQSQYRGIAPGVNFLVAKTEIRDSVYEFPVEEDNWVAGLEWMEAHGADIVNSSLGYTNWYNWPADYDGKTSPASIAAREACRRGMIIVTAAGNVAVHQLVIPGDAEGAITVGGIDTLFGRWRYSGWGPTNDGRRKPELVSLAAATVVVDPDSTSSYLLSTGTSGATAMVSGMCALLLEIHPNWSVDSIRQALFTTASDAGAPTDSMGFGWPDVFAAANKSPWFIQDTTPANAFLTPYPNPFTPDLQPRLYLPFRLKESGYATLKVFSIAGRLIKSEERNELLLPGQYRSLNPTAPDRAFFWDGRDQNGQLVASGVYYAVLIMTSGGNDVVKFAVLR